MNEQLSNIDSPSRRVRSFDDAHGGRAKSILCKDWLVFPDGSYREPNLYGLLVSASELEPKKQLRMMLIYAEQKLEETVLQFEQVKADIKKRTEHAADVGCMPPSEDELKELRKLRFAVIKWKRKYNEIELELNPPKVVDPVYEAAKEKSREQAHKILKQIDKIEV